MEHFAAAEGRVDELRALASAGANLNEQDEIGLAPIHLAARHGHIECVRFLLSHGTPVSLRSWQQLTPLLYAAAHGHTDVVELLLDSGAKVSEVDIDLWSAAHHAAFRGHAGTLSVLLRRGSDIGLKARTFVTPMHLACVGAQRETMAVLILAGSSLDYQAPFISPISMMPCPAAPTEVEPGRIFEYSSLGAALGELLASGHAADAELRCSDGSIMVHRVVLAAAGAEHLLTQSLERISQSHARILLTYFYTGHVGKALMQGSPAPRDVLESDARLLHELMSVARAVGLPGVARDVQRSIVFRIGNGGPVHPDGFNADLELLARVTLFADAFDDDFRLLLAFFVLNNFSPLLAYHDARYKVQQLAVDRAVMVRALCAVLPGGEEECTVLFGFFFVLMEREKECKKEVRPSRWRHCGVPPMDAGAKQAVLQLLTTLRNDKLSGWFVYAVSALDPADDPARPVKPPVVPEYWCVTLYPLALDTISTLLQQDHYVCPAEVVNDIRLVFCNAMRFNDEGSEIYQHAAALYYVAGTLWNKLSGSLPPSQEPIEQGTLDDYINLSDPVVMERIHTALATGHGPDPNAMSYDPSNPPAPTSSGKKKSKPKSLSSSSSKRGRKELKESDWRPIAGSEPSPAPVRQASNKKASQSKRAKAAPLAAYSEPPPPLPVPDLNVLGAPSGIVEFSFEEKNRLGADIGALEENNLPGLFAIIQRANKNSTQINNAEDEIELDLNVLPPAVLMEIRAYVDAHLGK